MPTGKNEKRAIPQCFEESPRLLGIIQCYRKCPRTLPYPVMVMNQKFPTGFLSREPKRFLPEQLQAVLRRFDERCRDLEF
jgi:hypothetical protein